jgi:protein-disulfide isomerase
MSKPGSDDTKTQRRSSLVPYVAAFVIAVIGIALAVYLMHVHRIVHGGSGATPSCDYSTQLNCSSVALNRWSSVLGVPTAAWGLLMYAGFALLAAAGFRRRVFPEGPAGLLLCGAIPAVGFGLFLMYIMATEVRAWCVSCLGLDAVNVGLLICGLVAAWRRGPLKALNDDLQALTENKPAAIALVGGPALAGILVLSAYPSRPTSAPGGEQPVVLPDGGFDTVREELNLEGAPARGPSGALITIIEFSDYQCPYCRAAHEEIREEMEHYPDVYRFIHFHHPLDQACNPAIPRPFHPYACLASFAAICAQREGDDKFWQINDLLFERGHNLDEAAIRQIVGEVRLDWGRVDECMRSDSTRERVLHDLEQARLVPVDGTPTFVINGHVVTGFRPGLYRGLLRLLRSNGGHWPE